MNQLDSNFNKFYNTWILNSSIFHFIGFALFYLLDIIWIWNISIVFTFLIYIVKSSHYIRKLPFIFGYANWISLGRLVLILIGYSMQNYLSDASLFILFGAAILLDGIDGIIARKFKHQTRTGAILDMEIDALLVFILSAMHASNSRIPEWILISGSFRYIYAWMIYLLPSVPEKEPLPKNIRSTIAVIFFISLLIPFIDTSLISQIIVQISGGLILISFASSLVFSSLYRINNLKR